MTAGVDDVCGAPVEVRNRFEGTWCADFQVVEADELDGRPAYRVRRGDGTLVPGLFPADELRPAGWEPVVDWQLPNGFPAG
jgi:hypothetical protein